MDSATLDPFAAAEPILAASGVQVAARGALPSLTLNLVLCAGELQLVHSKRKDRSSDVADVLLGLAAAREGSVRFLGRSWRDLGTRAASELRRAVGRVQEQGNWMDTRSVMDGVLLPARHHTVVAERELRDRASALARQFGLPGLPLLAPGECVPGDLERAACVRAFLGRPVLVVLEHPMALEDSDLLVPMMNAIQQVRRRGGSVLWFTEHARHAVEAAHSADRRCQLVDTQLIDLEPNR